MKKKEGLELDVNFAQEYLKKHGIDFSQGHIRRLLGKNGKGKIKSRKVFFTRLIHTEELDRFIQDWKEKQHLATYAK